MIQYGTIWYKNVGKSAFVWDDQMDDLQLGLQFKQPPQTVYHAYKFWNWSLKIYAVYLVVYISSKVFFSEFKT